MQHGQQFWSKGGRGWLRDVDGSAKVGVGMVVEVVISMANSLGKVRNGI